jgi:hypothetical protein
MSKEEISLEDLDPIFKQAYIQKDKEDSAVAKKSEAKGDDKKSLVEKAKQELNIPVEDRYLLDLLGMYGGKKAAQMLDAGVRKMPEPSASAMRGVGFGTAGLGPANAPRMPPMAAGAPPSAPQGFAPPSAPPAPNMPRPVAGGPAGPVGGPASPLNQMSGSGVFNYGKAFDLTDIEAGRALDMTKNPGGVHDLTTQRREALNRIQSMGGGYVENPRYGGIMTPQQSAGGGPRASFAQQPAIPPSPDMPGGRQPGLAQIPTPQPVSTTPPAPPRPGPLSQAAGVLKQGAGAVLNAPGVSGALGGLGMAESGQEFMKRQAAGDVPGQIMAGMGVAGGGLAMVPNPMAKALGAALATASPLSLYLYDKIGAPSDAPELTEQEKMLNSRPAFGMYPQMPRPQLRPRVPAPGTNLPPVEFMR